MHRRLARPHGLVPGGDHGLRRASRGGGRDRDRAQQRSRVLLSRHDAQRALRPDGQPVRARPLGRRKLGRCAPAPSRSASASWRSAPTAAARSAFPRRSAARSGSSRTYGLVPRAPDTRRLAAADAFRPAHAQRRRLRPRTDRDGRPDPLDPARCRRSATTTSRPRASPAISRACAWLPPTTSATSASTARCASASPRPWRRSREATGATVEWAHPELWPRRSRSGTRRLRRQHAPVRARCSRPAWWATTRAR